MDRRAFLATIAAGVAAAADPERLLWVPGRKLISIPRPQPVGERWDVEFGPPFQYITGSVAAADHIAVLNRLVAYYWRNDPELRAKAAACLYGTAQDFLKAHSRAMAFSRP